MSEKYSSHKDWTFGMECELPYKVRFALSRLPDSMTFLEVTHGGDTVIRLFSDMGRETRTIEIVTEPLKIGQEKERNQNLRIMAFLEDFLERYSAEQGAVPGMVTKTQVNEAFSAYTDLEDNADLKEFKVKLLCSAFIVKDVMGNNQISFGMGFDEVRALLRSMEWSCGGHMAPHMFLQKVRRMNVIKRYTITSYAQFLIWLICICMTVRLILRTQEPRTAGD